MSYIEVTVKVSNSELKSRKDISVGQSGLDVFETVCAEVRATLRALETSDFEVVGGSDSTPVDGEHYAEEVSTSSATDAHATSRVSEDRIKHAERCGKACGRLLIGLRADFPADLPMRLRPNHYVLIRDLHGARPQNGIAVFSQWCDIQPFVQEFHESSGKRTLGEQAIFKGLPSKSEVDAFVRGFKEQQRSAAESGAM